MRNYFYLNTYFFPGALELLDVRSQLPGLKSLPGLSEWKVANKELDIFEKMEEVPEKNLTHCRPNMFPPSPEIVKDMHLERWYKKLM